MLYRTGEFASANTSQNVDRMPIILDPKDDFMCLTCAPEWPSYVQTESPQKYQLRPSGQYLIASEQRFLTGSLT